MSEDETRRVTAHEEEGDEVEAHRRAAADEETVDETDSDDVEAHVRRAGQADDGARGL
jgi:hypothetical protein